MLAQKKDELNSFLQRAFPIFAPNPYFSLRLPANPYARSTLLILETQKTHMRARSSFQKEILFMNINPLRAGLAKQVAKVGVNAGRFRITAKDRR